MNADIVANVEALTHRERFKALMLAGRSGTVPAQLAASDNKYDRSLWAMSQNGARDAEAVARFLVQEPTTSLRWAVVRLAMSVCSDAQILGLLSQFDDALALRAACCLRRAKRLPLVDAFVRSLNLNEHRSLVCSMMRFGSTELVRDFIKEMSWHDTKNWMALVSMHAAVVQAHLLQALQADFSPQLLHLVNVTSLSIAKTHADLVLPLAEALARKTANLTKVNQGVWNALFRRRPQQVAALVLAMEGAPAAGVCQDWRGLRKLEAPLLGQLLQRSAWFVGGRVLAKLPPAVRERLYEERATQSWLSVDVLSALPNAAMRAREALKALEVPATKGGGPFSTCPFGSLLDWDAANTLCSPFLKGADASQRAMAAVSIMGVARYHSGRLSDALVMAVFRKNEQEPVRRELLKFFASLPISRWKAEHLPALAEVVQSNVDALDTSHACMSTLATMALKLMAFTEHKAWAAQQLLKMAPTQMRLGVSYALRDVAVPAAMDALLPIFKSWLGDEKYDLVFASLRSLGARTFAKYPALMELLRGVINDPALDKNHLEAALNLAFALQPRSKLELVPLMLQRDATWITKNAFQDHVLRTRQDLLAPYLTCPPIKGMWDSGKSNFLPYAVEQLRGLYGRLTKNQQCALAAAAAPHMPTRPHESISLLGALEYAPAAALVAHCSLDNKTTFSRDLALAELAKMDVGPQHFDMILEALSDDRARIAIYAVRKQLLKLSPSGSLALLRRVSMKKVTVAKEVLRLMGDVPNGQGFGDLVRIGLAPEPLHQDVRVALFRALWPFIDRKECWPIFESGATSTNRVVALGTCSVPLHSAAAETKQWALERVYLPLLGAADEQVRYSALGYLMQGHVTDERKMLAPALRECVFRSTLGHPTAEQAAALQAAARVYWNDTPYLVALARELLTDARRKGLLWRLLDTLGSATLYADTVWAVVELLAEEPRLAARRVKLCIRQQNVPKFEALLQDLKRANVLHGDLVGTICDGLRSVWNWSHNVSEMAAMEARLRGDGDERVRRIGFAALCCLASRTTMGWSAHNRNLLALYQADPSLLVSAAAYDELPPDLPQ